MAQQSQEYRQEIDAALQEVFNSGIALAGPQTLAFEHELSHFLNQNRLAAGQVLSVASGHDALLLALQSLSLEPTDEILFPVNAYPTAFPLALSGATPVPVDVDRNGQMDIDDVHRKTSSRTKVVVVVHLYGQMGNFLVLKQWCQRHHLILIEDCAQCFGTRFKNMLAGTLGDIGCFSFYPTKNLGTWGDGGALWIKSPRRFHHLLQRRSYGEPKRYMSRLVAGHSRLPELQAAILRVFLRHWPELATARQKAWQAYLDAFHHHRLERKITILKGDERSAPIPHLFVIAAPRRNQLQQFLHQEHIPTLIHYPKLTHQVEAFRHYHWRTQQFPQALRLSSRILSLPFHPYLSSAEIQLVARSIAKFYDLAE
jgi:dTDP-4-amino-4,6-dideoxygalactose transaminase